MMALDEENVMKLISKDENLLGSQKQQLKDYLSYLILKAKI